MGAVIVGGNIDHLTRVMTTAIALETSKGELELALALGFVLLSISLAVNFLAQWLKASAKGGPMSDKATPALNCLLPITVDNLLLALNDRVLIDRITCQIKGNGITIIMGPNGAGKPFCVVYTVW